MDTKSLEDLGFINTKLLSLSSDESSHIYKFNNPLKNVVSLEVCMGLIPRGEYTIESHRNLLVVQKESNVYNVVLDSRNYTSDELVETLNIRMESINISVNYNIGKDVIEFTSTDEFQLNMSLSTAYVTFGFDKRLYNSIFFDEKYRIIAPYRLNILGTDILFLHSSIDNSNSTSYDSPLSVFYLYDSENCKYWQTVRENPNRYFHPISSVDRLTLEFKDKNGILYNFNGSLYNVQLIVKYIDYGKNWSILDKESSSKQIHNLLSKMIHSAVAETIEKTELKIVNQMKDKQKENPPKKEWTNGGKIAAASSFLAIGGLSYMYLKKPKSNNFNFNNY